MKTIKRTSQFKKDVKRVQKRGKNSTSFGMLLRIWPLPSPSIRNFASTPFSENPFVAERHLAFSSCFHENCQETRLHSLHRRTSRGTSGSQLSKIAGGVEIAILD